jgi:hypothetical protein
MYISDLHTVLRIRDVYPVSRISDPGSKNSNKRGVKICLSFRPNSGYNEVGGGAGEGMTRERHGRGQGGGEAGEGGKHGRHGVQYTQTPRKNCKNIKIISL